MVEIFEKDATYEKIEEQKTRTFKEVKEDLEKTYENSSYRGELIRKTLTEKVRLRRTYAILIMLSPARIGELLQKVFFTRRTLYGYLYQLIELGLVKQISVMDLWNRRNLNKEEKMILKAFKEWTKSMADKQVQYFAGKTNYFILTDLGKDVKNINWVLKLEKEFKEINDTNEN